MGTQKNKNVVQLPVRLKFSGWVKKGVFFVLIFLFALPVRAEIVDRIIATVNQTPVTTYDFSKALDNIKVNLSKNPNIKLTAEDQEALRKRAFDHLVDEILLNQEIAKKGIDISDQDVNRAIQSILERNKFTLDQLKKELISKGSSYDAYREDIKGQLKRLKFINQIIGNKVRVNEEDVKAFYDQQGAQMAGDQQIHIAQIVFPLSENPSDTELQKTQAEAEGVFQKIKGGTKFEQAMKQYGAAGSGDLGKVNFSGISPQLAPAIQGLDEGEVTEPIRTQAGFIIVKLYDKPEAALAGSEDIKNKIRDRIYEIKVQEEIKKYVDQLRNKSFIDVKVSI